MHTSHGLFGHMVSWPVLLQLWAPVGDGSSSYVRVLRGICGMLLVTGCRVTPGGYLAGRLLQRVHLRRHLSLFCVPGAQVPLKLDHIGWLAAASATVLGARHCVGRSRFRCRHPLTVHLLLPVVLLGPRVVGGTVRC